MIKKTYTDFDEWKAQANDLGWVHCHDNVVVCDDEHGSCIGEFDSSTNEGWLGGFI